MNWLLTLVLFFTLSSTKQKNVLTVSSFSAAGELKPMTLNMNTSAHDFRYEQRKPKKRK